ncbi:MAG TPA: transglycosylase domain-containing protein, partial [Ktedonobacteraceae bacterium]|nr:transglycosylase domain-containing protein [Ktedonobacteraceae bacterium]
QGLPSLRTLPELPFPLEDEQGIGDTPNPAQGLQPVEVRPQGWPLPYTNTQVQMYAPHSTLLADVLRKQRMRKIMLRRYSRNQLRAARVKERRTKRRLWIAIVLTTLALLVVFLSVGSTAGYVSYRFVHTTQYAFQHSVVTLHDLLPLDNLKIYDSKGVLIDQLTDNGIQTSVTVDQVAPVMINATVATEDKNFWSNQGIDVVGIIRALLTNLESGRVVEGGSTITQQLIKNLIVGNRPTIVRKLEEIVLAPQVNNDYTKKDILTMYLNSIYYGNQAYGIDAAASVYFGLRDRPGHSAASQLDLAQSAMLAGLPSNPASFNPLAHPQTAIKRLVTVLDLMAAQRYISTADKYDAIQEAQGKNFFKTAATQQDRAPHFANFVLAQLQKMFHSKYPGDLSRSGMVVYTTLDISLQDKIQKIMQQHIAELRDAHHLTNAAEILIDFHTGAIISLLGSIDYNNASIDGQFDVTQAYRQPGSSFKPYVYVTAFQQGTSPAQAIDDQPITIPVPDSYPPTFSPTNYDKSFHGHMTLRCALQNSLNVPGVKVLQHVGINQAMQTAYNMGITSYQGTPGYSLVLGGLGIRLIDHTSAMGVFANGGVRIPYYAINKVVSGSTGTVLYQHQLDAGTQVISPQLAYMMTNVLSDNTDRIPEFYDCNVLQLYSNSQQDCWNGNRGVVRPAAAKTGTTNDFRDNWTVGYTTDYVMGVWAGNDDNSPMIDVSGITGAAPIWHDSMLVAEQGNPIQDFVNPGGLVRATVTYPDGVQTTDLFLPGTIPTYAQKPTPASDNGSTPIPGPRGNPSQPLPKAYCPASYSFAFPPPPDNAVDAGWW